MSDFDDRLFKGVWLEYSGSKHDCTSRPLLFLNIVATLPTAGTYILEGQRSARPCPQQWGRETEKAVSVMDSSLRGDVWPAKLDLNDSLLQIITLPARKGETWGGMSATVPAAAAALPKCYMGIRTPWWRSSAEEEMGGSGPGKW